MAGDYAIFDACDDYALVTGNFADYDAADRVAAGMRSAGDHGVFACQVCQWHEDEPAADCGKCGLEDDPDDDDGPDDTEQED